MRRIYSLDVLRGVAIAIMLFLDAPPDKIFDILKHAPWAGLTVPDVALPMFAFAMGASAAISTSRRAPSAKKILKRTTLMFAVGIFLNVLPNILAWLFNDGFTAENFFDAAIIHGRLFGVIQRLAVVYALGISLALAIKNEVGILIAGFVLLILSSAGFHIYAPENSFAEAHNISRAVDYIFPGANHIYTPTHDPEGLYGSLAATASVLFGFLAGKILIDTVTTIRGKFFIMLAAGVVILIAGGVWTHFDIISKKLWTAPFTLINAGGDLILLALLTKFLDESPTAEKFFRPLKALGTNPLFFFIANNIVLIFLFMLPGNLYLWFYQHTTAGLISVEFGATLFCVIWLMLWLPIAEIFYRRSIVIKI